jgi:hypothetical protein
MVEKRTANGPIASYSLKHLISIVLLGWLVMVALDFFQHAGLFARLWFESASAFLPPEKLFQRIPLGYTAFLLSAILMTWLMIRLNLSGWRQGISFGFKFGVISELASVLGTMSGFPVNPPLLAAWFFGGVVQYSVVCTVIGSGLDGAHPGRLWAKVIVFAVVLAFVTIILQASGYAPAMQYTK